MTADEMRAGFEALFPVTEVKWKAQTAKGDKAMAVAYVDARVVTKRLNDVAGIAGWQDAYKQVSPAAYECTLNVRFGDWWVSRTDVGGISEQPDAGDKVKAGYSDALKRAAVKFGIGAYLYQLPRQWVAYDANRKQLAAVPTLPAWARPQALVAAKPKVGPECPTPGVALLAYLAVQDRRAQDLLGKPAGYLTDYACKLAYKAGGGTDAATWPAEVIAPVYKTVEAVFANAK